ncbi:MAG: sensor histidine kinase [Granulosicoccus sp.]
MNVNTHYREFIAVQIQSCSDSLAQSWLNSLKSIVLEDTNDIFPTEQYLDHIPTMIGEIGKIVQDEDGELALINSLITRKALELGNLRHEQNATVSQLLREYDLLAQHLEAFLIDVTGDFKGSLDASDMMDVSNTIHSVVRRILQDTVDSFVSRYVETIEEQTEKLLHFNNFIGHEIRTPLQTALLNVELLMEDGVFTEANGETLGDVKLAVEQVITIMNNVESLVKPSDLAPDTPVTQAVGIAELVTDIADQLRQAMSDQSVRLEIADDLGVITTDTGKLRLILTNLLSNAIKYSAPERADSYVRVSSEAIEDGLVRISIEDNGIGISSAALSKVKDLKVRAHADQQQQTIEGHGIGLFLVEEAVKFLGGEVVIESTEWVGTTVSISLPDRP